MSVLASTLGRGFILLTLAVGLLAYQFPQKEGGNVSSCRGEGCAAGITSSLKDISDAVASVVRKAEKALVFVTVTRLVQARPNPFDYFFWPPRVLPRTPKVDKHKVSASGFFVDLDNGYIITNAHVVKNGERIMLTLANGEEHEAIVTGADENTDIAILQVENFSREGLGYLTLTSSAGLRTGDFVVALGAPFGFKASASFGIVSGLQRGNLHGLTALGNFIQTDAAINPGNSGGPLLNTQGQVVGVNSAIISVSGGYNGLGFAVPAEIAKKVAQQLVEKGKFERGYLGVRMQEPDVNLRDSFQVRYGEGGVIVTEVIGSSPAAQAGLQVGDVIVAVDGQKVSTPFELANAVGFNPPDTVIEVDYVRNGEKLSIEIKLGTASDLQEKKQEITTLWGLQIIEEVTGEYGERDVLLVLSSDNITSDVRRGDLIVAVDNVEVQGIAWLKNYLQDKKEVVLYVRRGGQFVFVTLHQQ